MIDGVAITSITFGRNAYSALIFNLLSFSTFFGDAYWLDENPFFVKKQNRVFKMFDQKHCAFVLPTWI
jgi:hypothetical protein